MFSLHGGYNRMASRLTRSSSLPSVVFSLLSGTFIYLPSQLSSIGSSHHDQINIKYIHLFLSTLHVFIKWYQTLSTWHLKVTMIAVSAIIRINRKNPLNLPPLAKLGCRILHWTRFVSGQNLHPAAVFYNFNVICLPFGVHTKYYGTSSLQIDMMKWWFTLTTFPATALVPSQLLDNLSVYFCLIKYLCLSKGRHINRAKCMAFSWRNWI